MERPPTIQVADDTRLDEARQQERVRPAYVNRSILLLRVLVGLLFIGHGSQKVFGWFGGTGWAGWTDSIQKAGMQPVQVWATLAAGAELVGGLLLVLGLLTPFAAAVIFGDMVVAILKVNGAKGLWTQQGGFEYELVLCGLLLVVGVVGPGMYSLDRHLPITLPRPWTFAGALLVTLVLVGIAVAPTLA